jgi:hypothetical protein
MPDVTFVSILDILQADEFSLRLLGHRTKLIGASGSFFIDHLDRLSRLDGWINCDIINEWATKPNNSSSADIRVLQNGFFNTIRKNCKLLKEEKLEIWWAKFIRGSNKVCSSQLDCR